MTLSAATQAERQQLIRAAGPAEVKSVADLSATAQDLLGRLQRRADRRQQALTS